MSLCFYLTESPLSKSEKKNRQHDLSPLLVHKTLVKLPSNDVCKSKINLTVYYLLKFIIHEAISNETYFPAGI